MNEDFLLSPLPHPVPWSWAWRTPGWLHQCSCHPHVNSRSGPAPALTSGDPTLVPLSHCARFLIYKVQMRVHLPHGDRKTQWLLPAIGAVLTCARGQALLRASVHPPRRSAPEAHQLLFAQRGAEMNGNLPRALQVLRGRSSVPIWPLTRILPCNP